MAASLFRARSFTLLLLSNLSGFTLLLLDRSSMGKRRALIKEARKPHAGAAGDKPGGGVKKNKKKKLKIKPLVAAAAASSDIFGRALPALPALTTKGSTSVGHRPEPTEPPAAAFDDVDKNELFRRVISYNAPSSGMIPTDEHRSRMETLKQRKRLPKSERRAQQTARYVLKK